MPLTMRPAGLSSGIDQDRADYTVSCGEWNIGRIYEVRGGPENLRWFWALHFPSKPESLRTDNRAATLEEAKAEFQKEGLGEAGGGTVTRIRQFRIARDREINVARRPPSKSFQQYRPKTDMGPLACQQQHLDSEQFSSAPRT